MSVPEQTAAAATSCGPSLAALLDSCAGSVVLVRTRGVWYAARWPGDFFGPRYIWDSLFDLTQASSTPEEAVCALKQKEGEP